MVLLPDANGTDFIIIIHHIPPFANSKNLRHTLCRRLNGLSYSSTTGASTAFFFTLSMPFSQAALVV